MHHNRSSQEPLNLNTDLKGVSSEVTLERLSQIQTLTENSEYQEALPLLEKAANQCAELDRRSRDKLSFLLGNMAFHLREGHYRGADSEPVADNNGLTDAGMEDYQKAIDLYHKQIINALVAGKDRLQEDVLTVQTAHQNIYECHRKIGDTFSARGDIDQAENAYTRAQGTLSKAIEQSERLDVATTPERDFRTVDKLIDLCFRDEHYDIAASFLERRCRYLENEDQNPEESRHTFLMQKLALCDLKQKMGEPYEAAEEARKVASTISDFELPEIERADCLFEASKIIRKAERFALADSLLRTALVYLENQDKWLEAEINNEQGHICYDRGEFNRASEFHKQALRVLGEPAGWSFKQLTIAAAINLDLAVSFAVEGSPEEAERSIMHADTLFRASPRMGEMTPKDRALFSYAKAHIAGLQSSPNKELMLKEYSEAFTALEELAAGSEPVLKAQILLKKSGLLEEAGYETEYEAARKILADSGFGKHSLNQWL